MTFRRDFWFFIFFFFDFGCYFRLCVYVFLFVYIVFDIVYICVSHDFGMYLLFVLSLLDKYLNKLHFYI